MSTTIDQKVVEMRFDNKQFESGVQTTMSTLGKLKQSLNLSGASKALDDVNSAARRFGSTGLGDAVAQVAHKFSSLQIMGVTALANITNAAVNAGKRIVSALTIDPIMTGFSEYETKMNAVQVIQANTRGKNTMEEITASLEDLNQYADKTIYNFAQMTSNIGKFTAQGFDVQSAANAVKGMANLAAASGASAEDMSRATYQMSQALGGTIRLMDWNSLRNANMATVELKNTLMDLARVNGIAIDDMVKKHGTFEQTLSEGWLSGEMFSEAMNIYSGVYSEAELKAKGFNDEQIANFMDLAKTAESAATEVKTITQLWDVLKETAQSGWTQSWEYIVGDFETAKSTLTAAQNALGEMINKSSEARNAILKTWSEEGGRTALIDAIKNAFEGVLSIVKPVKEAFREIFPPITAQQLIGFTEGLRDLTAKLKLSDEQSAKLKSTFKGVFAVIDIGVTFIKEFAGGVFKLLGNTVDLAKGMFNIGASLGDWLVGIRDSIKETDIFGKVVDNLTGFMQTIIDKTKEFTEFLGGKIVMPGFETVLNVMTKIWEVLEKVTGKVVEVGSTLGNSLVNTLNPDDLSAGADVINGGLFAGLLIGITKFVNGMSGITDAIKDAGGFLDGIKDVLDGVKGSLEAWQQSLKANMLLQIASAIGILAASLLVISMIDSEKLLASLGAITVLFGDMMGSLALFNKIGGDYKHAFGAITTMIGMSAAVLILASALKKISSLNLEQLGTGLLGVLGVTTILIGAAKVMSSLGIKAASGAGQMIIMAVALKVLASACADFGKLRWEELAKGLVSITVLLAELAIFTKTTLNSNDITSTGIGLIFIGAAMKVFASAVKDFADMKWGEIGRGLVAMAGALTAVTLAVRFMPKNMVSVGAGLVVVSGALMLLAKALDLMSGMTWGEIGKGITVLGGAIAILAIGLNAMKNTLAGSAALLTAATAILILAPALAMLGAMSWGNIAKGLVALAGAFVIVGVAGHVLASATYGILAVSAAIAMIGAACLSAGVGIGVMAAGLTMLIGAFVIGGPAVVAMISDIIQLIPMFVQKVGEAIISFFQAIADGAPVLKEAITTIVKEFVSGFVECVPAVAEGVLQLVIGVMDTLIQYTPTIVDSLFTFVIGILDGFAARLPELIQSCVDLLMALFQGVVDAMKTIDTKVLVNGLLGVGLLSSIVIALATVSGFVPPAILGIIGMGIVVAGLAAVLAEIGMLAQLPGLSWLIGEGGQLLQGIGTALGKFVGGLAGGIASGICSQLPSVGEDLAEFMTNVKPFIEGAKSIDETAMTGVKSLAGAILALTAANVLEGVTSWITGGSSLAEFGEEIEEFAPHIKNYADTVKGIDGAAVEASATAAKSLSELAKNLPNSGGLAGWFAGENDISTFGEQLVPFGEGMKKYSDVVAGIDPEAITGSATAAMSLAELANKLPNSGGLAGWFAGENDISTFGGNLILFGGGLKSYSLAIEGIDTNAIVNSATAALALAELANNLPNSGGVVGFFAGENDISTFGGNLVKFGEGIKSYSDSIKGIDSEAVSSSATAALTLAELANNLPNSGGVVSWFAGENNISDFGTKLVPFGEGMKAYSDAIVGINSEAITASATAALSLGELASNLPNSGGLVSLFAGENDISKFGEKLVPFGEGMKAYSDAISGMNTEAVTASATAAQSLAELVNNLPNIGGIASLFAGEQNLTTFGEQLVSFGSSLKSYSLAVVGINAEAVTASATAATSLAELAAVIPSIGGIATAFAGEKNLATFGTQLAQFGGSLKSYSTSVTGIEVEPITASATAAKSLAELATYIPSIGGMATVFAGEKNLATFGGQLALFGGSLRSYSTSVTGIDVDAVSNSVPAAQSLADLASSLPKIGGMAGFFSGETDISVLGGQLALFGGSLRSYSQSVTGLNTEAIANSVPAAESLVELSECLPKSGGIGSLFAGKSDMSAFGGKLINFGASLKSYSDSVAGVDSGAITTSVTVAKKLVEMINGMAGINTSGVGSFKKALDSLGQTSMDGFIKAFSGSSSKLSNVGSNLTDSIAKGMRSKQNTLTTVAKSMIDNINNIFTSKANMFIKAGGNLINSLAKGMTNYKGKVKSAVTTSISSAVSGITIYYTTFYNAGSYLVSGFANGISSNSYKAKIAARAMAAAAANAAKKELDEHSPSKVGYEIGDFFGIAFVNSISDNVSKAYDASSEMANSARKGLSDAISKVRDFIDGGMDTQPTIRPVLDLSDVKAGASSIGSMFAMEPSVGVMTDLRSISSLHNSRIQNGGSDDVVSAINKLRDDLSNVGGTYYNVNGVTYDDGSNISDAVKSLVRAARVERRI